MYNANDRKDIRRAEKDAKIAETMRIDFLRAAMSTQAGRAWYYDLLEFCHLFADPFTNEALLEAYRKGERNVGLRIFSDILTHCPDYYIQMMKEANGRRTERSVLDSRADADAAASELGGGPDSGWDVEGRPDSDSAYDA